MREKIKTNKGISLIMLVLIIIILILVIILGKNILGGKSQKNAYTRTEVINLLENGMQKDNYICNATTTLYLDDNKTEEYAKSTRKIKGDKMFIVDEQQKNMVTYYDYKINKKTTMDKNKKIAIVSDIDSEVMVSMDKIYFEGLIELIKDNDNEYKYIKNEKINGWNCIKIKLILENVEFEVWIDEENGLVIKEDKYKINMEENKNKDTSTNYEIELNCVTDKDVEIPDLQGYKVKEI